MEGTIDISLYISYALLIVAIIAAVAMPLINSLGEPKNLIKTGIGLLGLLVLFLISWALSGDEVTARYLTGGVDESLSKSIGGALTMMYILMAIAIIGIVYTEVNKALK